ncbi:MAG: hypothetical protein K5866_01040, partial [Treponema sp.]|nr:hypothetical protein [Treponema sp.]
MGFSISHKNGFEKEPENGRHGHREENTINKNENDVGGKENKTEEKKLPPINTDLSIESILKGKSSLSASDVDKKRKRKEAEQKRKAWIEKNR